MTQEEKQLVLVDLCGRLPHGVKIRLGDYDYQVCGYNSEKEQPLKIWFYYDSNLTLKSYIDVYLTDYRPYLRPMSSMTEEEKEYYYTFIDEFSIDNRYPQFTAKYVNKKLVDEYIDWLNAYHFDYRGLIEKGLAIEAPKDMYKVEE